MTQPKPEWMPLYEEALGHDRFLGEFCAKCGHRGTAWADGKLGIAIRCPKCVRDRVRRLRQIHGTLPGPVAYLERMANGDIRQQSVEDRDDLTVDLDVFCRCARCDRLIQRKDARYRLPPGVQSSPPYCIDCYEALERTETKRPGDHMRRDPDGTTLNPSEGEDGCSEHPPAADPAEILDRYAQTILHFAGDVSIDLRVPFDPSSLDAVRGLGLGHRFAVVTAHNPGDVLPDDENARRHEALLRRIDEIGALHVSARGCSPDGRHCEESAAVAMPRERAVEIAREFGQDAIFWFERDTFSLVGACLSFDPIRLPGPQPSPP